MGKASRLRPGPVVVLDVWGRIGNAERWALGELRTFRSIGVGAGEAVGDVGAADEELCGG